MISPSKAAAIAGVNGRRFLRDRGNLFFVFVFPLALVLIIGLQYGTSANPRLAISGADTDLGSRLVAELGAHDIEIREEDDGIGPLSDRVGDGAFDAALVIPPDAEETLARGERVDVEFVGTTTAAGQELRSVADSALARAVREPTAQAAAVSRGAEPEDAARAVARLAGEAERIEVRSVTTGDRLFPEDIGGYDVGAPSMLVLFVFVNGLSGSYALIQTRQWGVTSRMMSTPTSAGTILFGEGLGRWLVGLIQGVYILAATIVLFGVGWGDPLGAAAVLIMLAAASAGAAMVFGTVFSDPDQASGTGVGGRPLPRGAGRGDDADRAVRRHPGVGGKVHAALLGDRRLRRAHPP